MKVITPLFVTAILLTLFSCKTVNKKELHLKHYNNYELAKEMNLSVIEGFFDGDSTNVPDNIYLLKVN